MQDSTANPPRDRYKEAGVNIEAGADLVSKISSSAKATARPGADTALGGFGGVFDLKACGYEDPLLVAGTDGVGTKLILARDTGLHDTIGQDLVAMCVNDLVVQGAEPLFFLDYAATGELKVDQMAVIIHGIAEACKAVNCGLIGGETAEMPGVYAKGDYDLAGFAVGAVERTKLLTGETITKGDQILGLPSTGFHSNGYSLVRKMLDELDIDLNALVPFMPAKKWAELLMTPTALYVLPCLMLHRAGLVKGFAHITGGGLLENIPRVLPNGVSAEIDAGQWALPELFKFFAHGAQLDPRSLLRTFNCGVGMVAIIAADNMQAAKDLIAADGYTSFAIGSIQDQQGQDQCRVSDPKGQWGLGQFSVTYGGDA